MFDSKCEFDTQCTYENNYFKLGDIVDRACYPLSPNHTILWSDQRRKKSFLFQNLHLIANQSDEIFNVAAQPSLNPAEIVFSFTDSSNLMLDWFMSGA